MDGLWKDNEGVSWGDELRSGPPSLDVKGQEELKLKKEYKFFHLEGNKYCVHDDVYLHPPAGPPYVARIESLYENVKEKQKCMMVRWFCRPSELPEGISDVDYSSSSKEVFMSWGNGSKNSVDPASTIRKCLLVCTAKGKWNTSMPSTEQVAAADHVFSRAFHLKAQKLQSLDLVVNQIGSKHVVGVGRRSEDVNRSNGGIATEVLELGKTLATDAIALNNGGSGRTAPKLSKKPVVVKKALELGKKPAAVVIGLGNGVSTKKSTSGFGKKAVVDAIDLNSDGSLRKVPEFGKKPIEVVIDLSNGGTAKKVQELGKKPVAVVIDIDACYSQSRIAKRPATDVIDLDAPCPQSHSASQLPSRNNGMQVTASVKSGLGARMSLEAACQASKRPRLCSLVPDMELGILKNPNPWQRTVEVPMVKSRILLLQNLDPWFSSFEIEDMLRQVLRVSCFALMLPPKDFSVYSAGQAQVTFQSCEEAKDAMMILSDSVLIWSKDERPVVATLYDTQGQQRNPFHGFLNVDKFSASNRHFQDKRRATATSHCSQPNTAEYEMGLKWRLIQDRSTEAWRLAALVLHIPPICHLF